MNNLHRGGGPQTAAGKIRSSQNAVKHDITSTKMFVLQNENPAAWAMLLDKCIAQFRPVPGYEYMVVEEIAFAKWRLRRLFTIENALYDIEMDEQAEALADDYDSIDEGVRKGHAFKSLADNSKATSLLNRYQARLERSCQRLEKNFYELRAAARAEAAAAAAAESPETETENAKRTPVQQGPASTELKPPGEEAKNEPAQNFSSPNLVSINATEVTESPMLTTARQIAPPPYKDVA